ncbi:MAG: glycoside hydrolase [Streptosporangiaceae bacterium]
MRIAGVDSTDLFGGSTARPLQIIKVTLTNEARSAIVSDPRTAISVRVTGPQVGTPEPALVTHLAASGQVTAEVPVEVPPGVAAGTRLPVVASAVSPDGPDAELAGEITVAEPGWVMWMVSHFHYDPVWWSTQGQFLESRLLLPDEHGEMPAVRSAFELVRLHLDAARRDPDYKFVLAELDYLKPHFDAHPEDRADLLDFIKAGRIELVGGNYNEPNTNLTCAESTIRNAVYGIAYQRDVLGGTPRTSWMLDAFGFDPGYPGLMAAAGLTESSWARGPFHQWGPNRSAGDNKLMQFASEFEWLSPDGNGLLTSYMANHYGAGWVTQHAKTLADAEADAYEQFRQLAPVAATRNVLLPVGGDHVVPSRWATAIHRDWNARYVWPRFVTAVPGEFFAAVRADAAERDAWITPQTRDMNPVYTGKDVTYIDTKQAQRAAETAVLDGERLAALAWLAGADYPAASLDKAWRQLMFGAHHDAITGTESDQVYLDLLGGWREAWERGQQARSAAIGYLAGLADTSSLGARAAATGPAIAIMVVNSLSFGRSAMTCIDLRLPPGWPGWLQLLDDSGAQVPFLAEGVIRTAGGQLSSVTVTFRATDVPGVGYRCYLAAGAQPGAAVGWQPAPGSVLENEAFLVEADPARGGTLARVVDFRTGTELIRPGANELMLQPEHPTHPRWGEGPWHLCPAGPGTGSSALPAVVRAERCPVGSRLVAEYQLGSLRVTQETLLWDGADRIEFRTHVDGSIGQDHLLRLIFPVEVQGGLPVYQTALSVIGRPPGPIDTDVAEHSYTLDSPANEWLAVGSTATVAVTDDTGARHRQAIGVAEVITPPAARAEARALLVALAAQGVTATCSVPDGPRYGYSELDSNLPDFRICLGGPADNAQTERVLTLAGPRAADALARELADHGAARLWIPAARSRSGGFGPGADLRAPLDLPVLIVAAADLAAEIRRLTADLADSVIEASGVPPAGDAQVAGGPATALAGHTVALLNRGTPSGLVTPDGLLTMALMRASSSWPCGVWMDGEKRTCPDGSSFAWQHWSHTFEYALTADVGDWRSAGFAAAGHDYNHKLLAVATGLHPGPLPVSMQLVSVEPATALLSALKPFGNPLAPAGSPEVSDGVTIRLRDIGGTGPVPARVNLFTGLAAANLTRLCEEGREVALALSAEGAHVEVPAAGTITLAVRPGNLLAGEQRRIRREAGATASPPAGLPEQAAGLPEPAQPVHARYWLHGKGPAPAGNMPVAVHLSPGELRLDEDGPAGLRLTVACGPTPAEGAVTLTAPAGMTLQPAGPLAYKLPPFGYQEWNVAVTVDPGCVPGRRFATAQITDPAGQLIEDSVLLGIGQPPPLRLDLPLPEVARMQEAIADALAGEADISLAAEQLALAPGQSGALEVVVRNWAASAVHGEAQLISPFGSWIQAGPWTTGFAVPAGAVSTVQFEVAVPPTARPGEQWWAIVKLMYFGRVRYTRAAEVTVIRGVGVRALRASGPGR